MEDGLSDNRVNCFHKDQAGYMWIGTRNGLNRFDGHTFKIYRPEKTNSISNEYINAIAEDTEGELWIGTMEGLNNFQTSNNKWTTILPKGDSDKTDIPSNLIWDLQFDRGLLWIASDVFEFTSYDKKRNVFTYYDWPAFINTIPESPEGKYNSIQKFARKSDHEFWLGTTRGLVHLDILTKKFTLLGAGYYGSILDIVYDSVEKKVFLSTAKGKCFLYDENKDRYEEVTPIADPYPSSVFPVTEAVDYWLPASNGIYKISPGSGSTRLVGHIQQFSGSLLAGSVNNIFRDNTGLRWIGTSNGIAIYDEKTAASFLPLISENNLAGDNKMGGVIYDTTSHCYLVCATDPGSVYLIDAVNGNILKIRSGSDGRMFSNCNTIKTDRENNIWLLTDREVYRFDRGLKIFRRFPMPNQGGDVGFRAFAQDAAGDYWFGTVRDALYYYRVKEKKFIYLDLPFLPWTKKITAICSDSMHQAVWISAYSSDVLRYDLRTGKMEGFEHMPGLSYLNLVEDIATDNHGMTWFATSSGGIFRFNPTADSAHAFSRFTMRSGLPANSFIALASDHESNIWLLSSKGIAAIDNSGRPIPDEITGQSFSFSSFGSDSRIPHSIFFDQHRKQVLTAVGGGLLINPVNIRAAAIPFNVAITDIIVGDRDGNSKYDPQDFTGKLPYSYNSVQFNFAGLYYGAPQLISYEYRLNGYDRHWLRSTDFVASYQNLPSGDYNFEARAIYRDGKLAGHTSTPIFHVVPPLWKTTWFTLLILFIAVTLVGWLIRNLTQKLNAEKVVSAFATSLYGQHTIEDICWDMAKNCVTRLGFTDCVIYEYDEERKLLLQKAAYGPKNPWQREIFNSINIPLGKGIVGTVAQSGIMEIIPDTRKDSRYIVDDERRLSEITVPIFAEGKLFGVIDSEHASKNFYTRNHARMLKKIAAVCAERIAKYLGEEKLRAKIARDLHDEMGSTLTSINIMSKVAMGKDADRHQVIEYLQKIKDNSGRILESIGDMVWVINPVNDNFERLMFRMKEFTAEILEPLKIAYHFREEGVLHNIQLNLEQRKDLYMIFKEAITNAVKYSNTCEISIWLSEKNGKLMMEIQDHGSGFDTSNEFSGNGLQNMKIRANHIGADLSIESDKLKGTRILLELNLT